MTDTEAIRKAIDALTIQDVYLRESRLSMASDYDPKHSEPPKLTNLAWGPKRARTIEAEDTTTKEKFTLWKVEFGTRCRLLKATELPENSEPKPEDVLVECVATFVAEYRLNDSALEASALDTFARHNVAYHIWPYWREFLHDVTALALLPRVTIPMHVFKAGPPTGPAGKDGKD